MARCRARRPGRRRGRAAALPVQCGGAAGTLSLVGELTDDPVAAARAFADELGLAGAGPALAHPPRADHARRGRARDRVRRARRLAARRRPAVPAGDRRARRGCGRGSWRVVDDAAQGQPGAERPGAQRRPAGAAARRPAAPRRGPGRRRAPGRRLARRVAGAAAAARARRHGRVAGGRAVGGLQVDATAMAPRAARAADDLLAERGRARPAGRVPGRLRPDGRRGAATAAPTRGPVRG